MGLTTRLKDLFGQWRSTDPYYYQCTVCDREFKTEPSKCPDCGGAVERVAGEATAPDLHP